MLKKLLDVLLYCSCELAFQGSTSNICCKREGLIYVVYSKSCSSTLRGPLHHFQLCHVPCELYYQRANSWILSACFCGHFQPVLHVGQSRHSLLPFPFTPLNTCTCWSTLLIAAFKFLSDNSKILALASIDFHFLKESICSTWFICQMILDCEKLLSCVWFLWRVLMFSFSRLSAQWGSGCRFLLTLCKPWL